MGLGLGGPDPDNDVYPEAVASPPLESSLFMEAREI